MFSSWTSHCTEREGGEGGKEREGRAKREGRGEEGRARKGRRGGLGA